MKFPLLAGVIGLAYCADNDIIKQLHFSIILCEIIISS